MRGPELLTHMLDPWFVICLRETIDTPELLEQHDRLYGTNLCRRGAAIELAVDDGSGRTSDDLDKLTDFVRDYVYSRVERPAGLAVVESSGNGQR